MSESQILEKTRGYTMYNGRQFSSKEKYIKWNRDLIDLVYENMKSDPILPGKTDFEDEDAGEIYDVYKIFLTIFHRMGKDFYSDKLPKAFRLVPGDKWKGIALEYQINIEWHLMNVNDNIRQIIPSVNHQQNKAFRFAIQYQLDLISTWRKKCIICGCKPDKLEKDHVYPFCDLVRDFKSKYALNDDDLKTISDSKGGEVFLNSAITDKWKTFHDNKSKIQLLCVACHKNKTKDQMSQTQK